MIAALALAAAAAQVSAVARVQVLQGVVVRQQPARGQGRPRWRDCSAEAGRPCRLVVRDLP